VGFAIGMERLLDLCEQSAGFQAAPECQIYMGHQSDEAQRVAATLAETRGESGFQVIVHPGSASFKSQFKRADASGAQVAVILGQVELTSREAGVKCLRHTQATQAQQETIPLD